MVQKRVNGGKERDLDSLVAGGLGGWWVFGDRTPVSFGSGSCVMMFRRGLVAGG